MNVDRRTVLAYRAHATGLTREQADPPVLDLGVQDTPAGSAMLALAARMRVPDDTGLTMVWSHRGAPHLHRPDDLHWLAAALWPLDDADASARLNGVFKDRALAALTAAAKAMRAVVKTPTEKGDASAAVTQRVPDFSSWCRSCASTHVNDQLFRLSALPAGLRIEPGRSPLTFVPIEPPPPIPARAVGTSRVVSAYLRLLGPATPADVAGFLGTKATSVRPVWPEGLTEVRVGGRRAWIAEADRPALAQAEPPRLVRLLPPSDPFLQARDRDVLLPDKAHRAALWRNLGRAGAVLVDAEIVAMWIARSGGRTLAVDVTPFVSVPARARRRVEDEAARVAALRGLRNAAVTWSRP